MQREISEQRIDRNGLKTILVPTDFSEHSDVALQEAIDIARQQNARIYLLHIRRLTEEKGVDSPEEMISAQIGKFPDTKSLEIVPHVRHGSPYREILKEQEEKKIELIVIAYRGRTGLLRHHLTKNLAARIAKKAPCSVLLVGA
jgi:universal stress protein A